MSILAISRRLPSLAYEILRTRPDIRVLDSPHDRALEPSELLVLARNADALITTVADRIDAALLRTLHPRLKVVSQYAVGVNNIDIEVAAALGVRVANTPDVLTDATAELALTLMLACTRRVLEGDTLIRDGGFDGWGPNLLLGPGLTRRTVGIVGTGRIGRRTAELLRAGFDCEVIAWSRAPRHSWAQAHGVRYVTLDELLMTAHLVSLHCALTEETHHLIDEVALRKMRADAVLINTARGPIVDERALVDCLRSGRLFGAGLDVFEREPDVSPELCTMNNVVLLPHVGSGTTETRDAMVRLCLDAALSVLDGAEASNLVV